MKEEAKDIRYSIIAFIFAFAIPILTFLFIFYKKLFFEANNIQFIIFHSASEFFSGIVGISIFIISAIAYRKSGNRRLIIFGSAFLFMAIIDYLHAISFPDVRKVWEKVEFDANIMLWFWIISKLVGSSLIFASAFLPEKYVNEGNGIRNSVLILSFTGIILFFFLFFFAIEKNIQLFNKLFDKDVSQSIFFGTLTVVAFVSIFVAYLLVKYLSKFIPDTEESRNVVSLSIVNGVLLFSFIIFYVVNNYQHNFPKLINIKETTALNFFLLLAVMILVSLTTTRYLLSYIERKNIVLFFFTIGFIFFIFSIISNLPGRINDLYITIGHIFNIFFNIAILFALLIVIKKD